VVISRQAITGVKTIAAGVPRYSFFRLAAGDAEPRIASLSLQHHWAA
jgi:hypothetical protein